MSDSDMIVDERTRAVSHQGGYYAYLVMSWLLVGVLALREVAPDWGTSAPSLEVLLVLVGGAVTHLGFTFARRATSARALGAIIMSPVIAGIAAAALVFRSA